MIACCLCVVPLVMKTVKHSQQIVKRLDLIALMSYCKSNLAERLCIHDYSGDIDILRPYETAVHNGWPCFKFSDTLQPTKALDLLLNLAPESDKVCSSKPVGVTEQSTFVIASKHLENEADIKADDLGVWIHKGKPVRMYKVARSQSGSVLGASLTKDRGENVYKLIRVYYHHKHTGTFRCTLFFAYGKSLICMCLLSMCSGSGLISMHNLE